MTDPNIPTDHALPADQPFPLTGTALHLFPNGDGAFAELCAGNLTIASAELQAIAGLTKGTPSGNPSVSFLIRTPDGRQYVAETTLKLLVTATAALIAVHGDPRT